MSNHLAIATVTAALRHSLQTTLDNDVPGLSATVSTLRPSASGGALPTTGVNLFLFQVTPNAALRNADLPTRRGDGTLLQHPTAALDLHYLLSFYGDDSRLEQQVLLAATVRMLHTQPVLDRQAIQAVLAAQPTFDFVVGSDLADAIDLVRFTPTALSLKEMWEVWAVFPETPYALSVAYQAGVVLIDQDAPVAEAPPVRRRPKIYALPVQRPLISGVLSKAPAAPTAVAGQPILVGYTLVLAGTDLEGAVTVVQIDGADAAGVLLVGGQLTVPLPLALPAGAHGVQVIQQVQLGKPATPHDAVSSNVATFVLQPTVTATATDTEVTLTITPDVGVGQRVRLLLNELGTPPGSQASTYGFDAPAVLVASATITVPIQGVASGTYLVRAQVDGAESPVDFNAALGVYDSPVVTVP